MQPVQQRQPGWVKIRPAYAQAGAGSARVVNSVVLSGKFRVHTQAAAFAGRFGLRPKFQQLIAGIENDMVGILQQLGKLIFAVSGGKNVYLAAHFLFTKAGFKQAAGCGSLQILANQGVSGRASIGLLG